MGVLVVGSGGLLGSHLVRYLKLTGVSRAECNILSAPEIAAALNKHKPDVVINCAGIVPKSPAFEDTFHVLRVNSLGPRILANECDKVGCRLIHISTDCVYSGVGGGHKESDLPYPIDLYGMSKFLGEITHFPHLTIRTSFVGLPDPTGRGLLSWAQGERRVVGYDKVIWNGLTTLELGKILVEKLLSPWSKWGLLHLPGEALTKLDVLVAAATVWNWKLTVVPESNTTSVPHRANKTLMTDYPQYKTEKTLYQMLRELKAAEDDLS